MLKIFNKNTQKKEEIECESEKKNYDRYPILGYDPYLMWCEEDQAEQKKKM